MREKIFSDMIEAIKSQDKELLAVLRLLKGAIQLEELSVKRELNDDELTSVINRQIKQRKEALEQFEKGNRQDLIDKTTREIEILSRYLPEQLSEEELAPLVAQIFDEVKPTSAKDFGKLMGKISPLVKGKADMGLVSKLIKDRLESEFPA